MAPYPKRLIEVDLPIKRISAHARREKSIRHGHISTLHVWWARRPLAACRAVLCAALWPDPADALCPFAFRQAAAEVIETFAHKVTGSKELARTCSEQSFSRWNTLSRPGFQFDIASKDDLDLLRLALLDFIADFANWGNSTESAYLKTARALTQSAHEALGGLPGTRPLVVDPFAGGGSIPLEALRIGADAFASDLNPVAVLLNKVVLEYIPKYGQPLADAVRKWGDWIKEEAEEELSEFYSIDSDEVMPIAYLWARTITCEGPGCGAQVPLMRSLWLTKRSKHSVALRFAPDRERKHVDFQLIHDATAKDVSDGTVRRGSATCPVCDYTTPVESVRRQLKSRRGGATDARLFCVVTTRSGQQGRTYRLPNERDLEAVRRAAEELERRNRAHTASLSLVPDEEIPLTEIRRLSAPLYGMNLWGDLFTPRQALVLTTLARLVREIGGRLRIEYGTGLGTAVQTCLTLAMDRQANTLTSLSRWNTARETVEGIFGRQAIPMIWDFADANPFSGFTGCLDGAVEWVAHVCEKEAQLADYRVAQGHADRASATQHPLPDASAQAFITDPPYYDAVPYAHLSDFFYVWLKRVIGGVYPDLFNTRLTPKDGEIVVDRPHQLSLSTHDINYYERELLKALAEGRRVLSPSGVAVIVFASKTTASWEALLQAVVQAGWVITGSWPIDTEMATRVASIGQARLMSSIHLVCRPRENPDGSLRQEVGDWRDVLVELPDRIRDWFPHLVKEGVVGSDAIFACLGPALEIFSRHARVEKASGDPVTLRDYLEHVWAAVAREALSAIFEGADAAGFEEDARLTAIWFWTMKSAANGESNSREIPAGDEGEEPSEEETVSSPKKLSGYLMEYDAARKLAQGLGADLRKLSQPGGIVTIKGNIAALNTIASRERRLIGFQLAFWGNGFSVGPKQAEHPAVVNMQPVLFREEYLRGKRAATPPPADADQLALPGLEPPSDTRTLLDRLQGSGVTTLDRLHQAMLLFGRSQTALLGPFLTITGMGYESRFWTLAQALSALYPAGSEEKRWVDGVLARKKGLGF